MDKRMVSKHCFFRLILILPKMPCWSYPSLENCATKHPYPLIVQYIMGVWYKAIVWGWHWIYSRTRVINITTTLNSKLYTSDVLEFVNLSYLENLPSPKFQDDNAQPHATFAFFRCPGCRTADLICFFSEYVTHLVGDSQTSGTV